MAEILGLGITHQPSLAAKPIGPGSIKVTLKDPGLPEHLRIPSGWPENMRREWGDDEGASHGREHRDEIIAELGKVRKILDDFEPDFVVIWGDDQYENFREDAVPAFCVMGYDAVEYTPWAKRGAKNYWDEPADKKFTLQGHRSGAKYLATGLLEQSFDIAYAYKPLHDQVGHAISNGLLYLDWDRRGFDYPVVPITVNCFGRQLILRKGHLANMAEPPGEDDFDPPSPSPSRCFELGAACVRTLSESPWRVALIASSSWSHAFLTEKYHFLWPDHAADQELYKALVAGDYDVWKNRSLASIEDAGQHELLNWFCLIGAMAELDRRPDHAAYIESSVMNSNKVIAAFRP